MNARSSSFGWTVIGRLYWEAEGLVKRADSGGSLTGQIDRSGWLRASAGRLETHGELAGLFEVRQPFDQQMSHFPGVNVEGAHTHGSLVDCPELIGGAGRTFR